MRRSGARRVEVMWRLRRSPIVRQLLRFMGFTCAVLMAIVVLITAALTALFGHAVVWSVIGALFAIAPLVGLLTALAIGLRAAVAAGPGWIGLRVVRRWRIIDLDQVRTVRLADDSGLGVVGGFGGGFGSFGAFGGPARWGGGGSGARSVVIEDAFGGRFGIGLDALDAGIADVLRHGLASGVDIDPDAARALGQPEDDPQEELGRPDPR